MISKINVSKEVAGYRNYLLLANFKKSTVSMYCRTVEKFLEKTKAESGLEEELNQSHAQSYLLMRLEQGKAWSSINVDYSSLRKYFKERLDYNWSVRKLPRPRKENKLPSILSRQEVHRLIEHASTYKHQVFLTFLYGSGCRLSEATHVRLIDIDGARNQIHIHRGKGAKDRKILVPKKLIELLRDYYQHYKPEVYLFNGRKKGEAYSFGAAQWSIRRARLLAKIKRKCTIHALRNCYATHHLELGTDLVFLQQQLGHKHLKTTAKYIRLCIERYQNVQHPLDRVEIKYHRNGPKKST